MINRLKYPLLAALTLGLAPFVPSPHIIGKLKWIWGGAVGMQPMDWFDAAFHGAPWIWLAVVVTKIIRDKTSESKADNQVK